MAINPTIGDLSGAFAPQQAMAQSGLGQVLAGVKDDKLAALMMRGQTQRPMAPPNAPKLNFDTNATGIGTGIMQGLGNAVNNSLQMRQFGQQQQAQQQYMQQQRDWQQQLDLALAEKQKAADLAAAQKAANEEIALGGLTPRARATFGLMDPEGKRPFLNALAQPDLGGFVGQGKGAEAKAAAPGLGEADAMQKVTAYDALMKAIESIGPLETNGVPNPPAIRAYSQLLGGKPYTSLDASNDVIDAKRNKIGMDKDANDLAYQPQRLENQNQADQLANSRAQIELKYADALKEADMILGQGKVDEAQKLKDHLTQGRKLWEDAMSKYDQMTPGQVKLFNSRMHGLEVPFSLPEKKEPVRKPLTRFGQVTGFVDDQGHVYDAKGKLKQ